MQAIKMSQLSVTAVSEVKTAKDGRSYFIVSFSPGFGQKSRTRVLWQQFKQVNGVRTEEKAWERGTPSEALALLKSKEKIAGAVITATVEPYSINEGPEFKTYTTVIFPDEADKLVSVFSSLGHSLVDTETGEVLRTAPRAILAPKNGQAESFDAAVEDASKAIIMDNATL